MSAIFWLVAGADGGHGGLGFLVGLDPDLVDPVGDVLLLRGFQRLGQRIIEHDPLLGVRLQLVDQHHLRGRLVLQAVDPGLALFDIAFKGLAVRQLDLFLLHHLVVLGIELGQIGLQLGARGGVLFDADLVFQLDDLRVHAQNLGTVRLSSSPTTNSRSSKVVARFAPTLSFCSLSISSCPSRSFTIVSDWPISSCSLSSIEAVRMRS